MATGLHIVIGNRRKSTKCNCDERKQFAFESTKPDRRRKQPHFLVRVNKQVDWQLVVSVLDELFPNKTEFSFPPLLLLKMFLLGQWYMLPDIEVEDACRKKGPYRRFLKIGLEVPTPNWITVARFRKRLFSERSAKVLLNNIHDHLVRGCL